MTGGVTPPQILSSRRSLLCSGRSRKRRRTASQRHYSQRPESYLQSHPPASHPIAIFFATVCPRSSSSSTGGMRCELESPSGWCSVLAPACALGALAAGGKKHSCRTMDFDADRIYYSHQNLHQQTSSPAAGGGGAAAASASAAAALDEEDRQVDADALRRHYREFLSEFVRVREREIRTCYECEWRFEPWTGRIAENQQRWVQSPTAEPRAGGSWCTIFPPRANANTKILSPPHPQQGTTGRAPTGTSTATGSSGCTAVTTPPAPPTRTTPPTAPPGEVPPRRPRDSARGTPTAPTSTSTWPTSGSTTRPSSDS